MNKDKLNINAMIERGTLPDTWSFQHYRGYLDGRIILNDNITGDIVEDIILPLEQFEEDPDIENITLLLNSKGGSPYDGMAVVAALERCSKPVTIRIVGQASSAALFIAMARGSNIITICDKYSVGLMHPGSVFLIGNAAEIRDSHDFLIRYDEEIIKKFILSHTSMSEKEYERIKDRETYMTAEDMKEYGIVDRIV